MRRALATGSRVASASSTPGTSRTSIARGTGRRRRTIPINVRPIPAASSL